MLGPARFPSLWEYTLTTPSAVVTSECCHSTKIFHIFPSVWWIWNADADCCRFGRSESISDWSVALPFPRSVSSSQRAKSLSHIDVMKSFRMNYYQLTIHSLLLCRYCPTKSDHYRSQGFLEQISRSQCLPLRSRLLHRHQVGLRIPFWWFDYTFRQWNNVFLNFLECCRRQGHVIHCLLYAVEAMWHCNGSSVTTFQTPKPEVVYRFESVRGFNFHWSVVDVQKSWKMGRWALSPTSRIWQLWLFDFSHRQMYSLLECAQWAQATPSVKLWSACFMKHCTKVFPGSHASPSRYLWRSL